MFENKFLGLISKNIQFMKIFQLNLSQILNIIILHLKFSNNLYKIKIHFLFNLT
jgi:hypothetical protein